MALEDFVHRRRIADVDLVMLIARQTRPQLIPCFSSRGFFAKKLLAHVVVDPDHPLAIAGKAPDRFRADQAGRAVTRTLRAFGIASGALADHPGQAAIGRVDESGWIAGVPREYFFEQLAVFIPTDKKQNVPGLVEQGQGHR